MIDTWPKMQPCILTKYVCNFNCKQTAPKDTKLEKFSQLEIQWAICGVVIINQIRFKVPVMMLY